MSLLGYEEAAEFLGLKKATLYALVSQQRVPHVRLGPRCVRFERDTLTEWVARHRVGSTPDRRGSR